MACLTAHHFDPNLEWQRNSGELASNYGLSGNKPDTNFKSPYCGSFS